MSLHWRYQPSERIGTMTDYTTLKLTKEQVRALYAAINIYEASSEGLTNDELEDWGYQESLARHAEILGKLRKSGWNV
jgi:hypothetical protein